MNCSKKTGSNAFNSIVTGSLALLVLLTIITEQCQCAPSQSFYPNGRYGRRSDPEMLDMDMESGAENGGRLGRINGLTRLGTALACTYTGFGDLFQCSLRPGEDTFRGTHPKNMNMNLKEPKSA